MATTMSTLLRNQLDQLRIEPVAKHVRAVLGGETVVDSRRAVLVWEPRRVVATYAVPLEDLRAPYSEVAPLTDWPAAAKMPVWDPRVPFGVRTTPGRPIRIAVGDATADGFLPDDPDLDGFVSVDFDAFDRWLEDEDEIIAHPHDPFSRIDIRSSDQRIEVSWHAEPLASTERAKILYETSLPPRFYLPREDVIAELVPSDTTTECAYKGVASYFSPVVGGRTARDIAWTYPEPLIDAAGVKDLVAFFDERVDVRVDGVERARPTTPWS